MYRIIPITPDLRELISEAASSLGGKSQQTFEEGEISRYDLTDECIKLAVAVTEAKVEDIVEALKTFALAKLLMNKRGEKRPVLVVQQQSGWLSTAENQIVIFAPLIKSEDEDAFKEAKIQFKKRNENMEVVKRDETALLPISIILIFQSVWYRIIPVEIPIFSIPCPILNLEAPNLVEHAK